MADLHNCDNLVRVIHFVQDTVVALADPIAFLTGQLLAAWWTRIIGQDLDVPHHTHKVPMGEALDLSDC